MRKVIDAFLSAGAFSVISCWARRHTGVLLVLLLMLAGCAWIPVHKGVWQPGKPEHFAPDKNLKTSEFFTTELKSAAREYSAKDVIQAASAKIDPDYRLGPGDRFSFIVRGFPDISRDEIIVAPDGIVALPRIGIKNVKGRTLNELTEEFIKELKVFYEKPEVTLEMKVYNNNRVYVLGRVANPGVVNLQGPSTLLEALSLCGGMPADVNKTFLSRCSITRGKNLVLWIDLRDLLERGNMALNAKLQNNDVIYIPLSEDQNAYVLGEVRNPGIVELRTEMNIQNAIMRCGGPLKTANLHDIYLIRRVDGKGLVEHINYEELIGRANYSKEYILRDGDTIFIPETGLSRLNYYLTEIQPLFTIIGVLSTTATSFGLYNLWFGTSTSGTTTAAP